MGVAPCASSGFWPARALEKMRPLYAILRNGTMGDGLERVLAERLASGHAFPRARLAPRLPCWTISRDRVHRACLGVGVRAVAVRAQVGPWPRGAPTSQGNSKAQRIDPQSSLWFATVGVCRELLILKRPSNVVVVGLRSVSSAAARFHNGNSECVPGVRALATTCGIRR